MLQHPYELHSEWPHQTDERRPKDFYRDGNNLLLEEGMIEVSNTDFKAVLHFLDVLSHTRGESIREREIARKAALLNKKLNRKISEK